MAQGRSIEIISMIKWIWTSRLPIYNSLYLEVLAAVNESPRCRNGREVHAPQQGESMYRGRPHIPGVIKLP